MTEDQSVSTTGAQQAPPPPPPPSPPAPKRFDIGYLFGFAFRDPKALSKFMIGSPDGAAHPAAGSRPAGAARLRGAHGAGNAAGRRAPDARLGRFRRRAGRRPQGAGGCSGVFARGCCHGRGCRGDRDSLGSDRAVHGFSRSGRDFGPGQRRLGDLPRVRGTDRQGADPGGHHATGGDGPFQRRLPVERERRVGFAAVSAPTS